MSVGLKLGDGMPELSKEAQQTLAQLQAQNRQLEALLLQKQSLILEKAEIELALTELGKEDVKESYKIAGPVMVKVEKSKLKRELEERKEEIEVRLKAIERNERKLREAIERTSKKLRELIPGLQGKAG